MIREACPPRKLPVLSNRGARPCPTIEACLQKERSAFDPEAVAAMSEAYDNACHSMHDWGYPAIIREIIAKRTIGVASRRERDPDEICERALIKSLGFSESPSLQPQDLGGRQT
jgi:hypothetical protein